MCTRFVYQGPGGRILTGRSMDWHSDLGSNLWVMPRGLEREGAAGPASTTWTSKYGSLVTAAYDICSCDGMNEVGLVANALWLVESEYGAPEEGRPTLGITAWAQYVLDNYATVADAVAELADEPFTIVTAGVPGEDRMATMHLALSDPTGDSAILEYIDGRVRIHHGAEYKVMTNSPPFDEQLAITAYWKDIGGTVMLPGTNRAADRYVRASFYVDAVPQVEDRTEATAAVFSVIRNASVPYGITTPGQPNIASTLWRTVADHKDRVYYFDSVISPSVIWVPLDDLDLAEGAPVQRLHLAAGAADGHNGNVASLFEDQVAPFAFAPSL